MQSKRQPKYSWLLNPKVVPCLTGLHRLLRSGLFSDVKVKCGDTTWQLHKNILCTRSQWFEKALTGSFEEAKTGVVEVENFAPKQIDWVLQYIYTGGTLANFKGLIDCL